jgi:hypothetical protein
VKAEGTYTPKAEGNLTWQGGGFGLWQLFKGLVGTQ